MEIIGVGVVAVLAVVATTVLAPRLRVAAPLLLVALGTGVSFVPVVGSIEIPPELLLAGILPPLLYASAVTMPTMEFRRNLRTISAFSVILVVLSAVLIGLVLQAIVPGLGLATGIAVGAILSPTDAVATSIVKRAGVSPRVITVLEGESMLNDASALVLLRSATAAAALGFPLLSFTADFVWAVVAAVAVGFGVGRINLWVQSRIDQPASNVALSFVVPFVAYVPAELVGASGLVAAVTAGLVCGHGAITHLTARDRLTQRAVWETAQLLLESSVFLLMGLQLATLIADVTAVRGQLGVAVALGLLCTALIIAVRTGYVALSLWGLRRRARRSDAVRERIAQYQDRVGQGDFRLRVGRRRDESTAPSTDEQDERAERVRLELNRRLADLDYLAAEQLGWREGVVLVWAGMRGAVTLAAAQSLPADTPYRSLLILVAFVVAAGTLLVQGGTLLPIARRLGLTGGSGAPDVDTEAALRAGMIEAMAARLASDDLRRPDGSAYDEAVLGRTRAMIAARRPSEDPDDPDDPQGRDSPETRAELRDLRTELIEAQRAELVRLRELGTYPTAVLSAALNQLDAEQLGLQIRDDAP